MRVVLSRKGMDSENGRMESPILPDGTMLSLPIPSKAPRNDNYSYSKISYNNKTLYDIIEDLNKNKNNFEIESPYCHLDPNLYKELNPGLKEEQEEWKPAAGHSGITKNAAAVFLDKHRIGEKRGEDYFLFFGLYRHVEINNNEWKYVDKSREIHAIYAYMKIGEVLREKNDIKAYKWHPHSQGEYINDDGNRLYIPEGEAWGTFTYSNDLRLTDPDYTKSIWKFPHFFKHLKIINQYDNECKKKQKRDGSILVDSGGIGQEFIIQAPDDYYDLKIKLMDWVNSKIKAGTAK